MSNELGSRLRKDFLAVLLAVTAGPLVAQTYEQGAPQTPGCSPATVTRLPAAGASGAVGSAGAAADAVLTPVLHGLVFVATADALRPAGVAATGVVTTGVAALDTATFR